LFPADQFNGLPARERLGICRERADADNFHRVSPVVGQQPGHLADDAHPYLFPPPLLALDQHAPILPAQDQIDPSVGPAKPSFLNGVPLPAESLAYQLLELPPARGSQALQRGTGIQELAPAA